MTKKGLTMDLQMFASPDYPEANLQDRKNFAKLKAIEIDFVNRFEDNFQDFVKALGITRQLPVNNGMTIRMYKGAKVELADGDVAEGAIIPLSKVTPQESEEKKINLKKYRKATSGEAIQTYGFLEAVNLTDEALVKEVQKGIRDDLFALIKKAGTTETNLNQGTLQGALATAWGSLQTLFEDDSIQTIAFVNPMDVAQEIAKKELTLENQFGLSYYTTVTGTVVFTSSQIERGAIYATAPENLVVAYINPQSSDLGQAFELTSDSFGYIGMSHFLHNETLTHQTLLTSGVLMYPERLDGVVKVEIGGVEA